MIHSLATLWMTNLDLSFNLNKVQSVCDEVKLMLVHDGAREMIEKLDNMLTWIVEDARVVIVAKIFFFFCSYCKKDGHTQDRCYCLHRYSTKTTNVAQSLGSVEQII
ncbi:hypothetical protein CR513_28412, partial [Mucuna pruriens]